MNMKYISLLLIPLIVVSCKAGNMKAQTDSAEQLPVISTNEEGKGQQLTVELEKGKGFYYPLFAIWLEDAEGKYIQTLYVARSVAKGVFRYGRQENNKWIETEKRAPQTLPYWAHKRGIKASDGLFVPDEKTAVPDAYTGATPVTGFSLRTRSDNQLPQRFVVKLEINQNWDWNEFWTNDKYPDDENYKMSCQPALVYEAVIENNSSGIYQMKPVGHSHYSGKTGELFTDLSTITTALDIVGSARVIIK
jgi:hypothetical protein